MVAKELTHRADELKGLGWSQEDVFRYIELWEYRQRWGAINLEREDRQFLRKVENSLPAIVKAKSSVKKSIQDKSYYRWLSFYLNEMNEAETSSQIKQGSRGIWAIILEEELRALNYYEPVLGLPDTLKAKLLKPLREEIVNKTKELDQVNIKLMKFDFDAPLKTLEEDYAKNWKPLREGISQADNEYPIIDAEGIQKFRKEVRSELLPMIKEKFPSLADSNKPSIPDDWSPKNNFVAKKEES
tara:strand:- start:55349 stop:56077 length:729 start_codon:yes stop_codon:yes gene_type:complete